MTPPAAGEPVVSPRWLIAALREALAVVGPEREAEIELPGIDSAAVLAALVPRIDRGALARALGEPGDDGELIAALEALGAFAPASPETTHTICLADALLDVLAGRSLTAAGPATVATADELLVLPAHLPADRERLALHSFVGAISPDLRQQAYCRIAAERQRFAVGDRPDAAAVDSALAALDGRAAGEVVVIDLLTGESVSEPPDRLGRIGFERPHRLGPLVDVAPLEQSELADPALRVYLAHYALSNFRFAERLERRVGGGRASDPALAELIARAEAAERHASGNLAGHNLVRSAEGDLDAPAVSPVALFRRNARQQRDGPVHEIAYDATAEHLWLAGRSSVGERRWVPADAVFFPFHDVARGGRTLPANSSGVAAHSTYAEARLRALCEIVERDAFMWTWVQGVGRELIDDASLPWATRERCASIRGRGLEVAFVNLTLDLLPVVACVIHGPGRVNVTVACSPDPLVALERSLDEGCGLADVIARGRLERVDAEQVVTPEQHAALHLDAARAARDGFFFASDERVGIAEIGPSGIGDPFEVVADRHEVIDVDLTTPASMPFHVARVLVPHLIPVSFGFDREPLGMPALAAPRRTHDDRLIGAALDLTEAGPLDPHPFA